MFTTLVCEYLFPSPIWCIDLQVDVKEISKYCLDVRDATNTRNLSNRGINSFQSQDIDTHNEIKKNKELSKLFSAVEEHANIAYSTYEPLAGSLSTKNFWININGYGAYNSIHTHPSSVLSGVFYVGIPDDEDCGAINFYRNQTESFAIKSLGTGKTVSGSNAPHSILERWYEPVENRLFLFPSWMPHDVGVNKSKQERISISFNLTN